MKVFTDAASMREFSRSQRREGRSIALVPTMVRLPVSQSGKARGPPVSLVQGCASS